jgi:hypothetical protein
MDFIELAKKNKEEAPKAFSAAYGKMVEDEIHTGFSPSEIEARTQNYLDDPTNERYIAEFKDLQAWRKLCKAKYKALLEID